MSAPRLLVVVGKGGVGRTTVAAGLALAAGREGKRALVIELNGLWDIGRRFGLARSFAPKKIADNVSWRSLTTRECMESFGRRKMKLGIVGSAVMGSRPMQAFVDAVPGLPDLLQLGKIENLLNEPLAGDPVYDLVVVDAPATGHGLTLLSAAQSMTEISGSGPFHELARVIAEALSDGTTGVVVTTLPELLPLSETLGLLDALQEMPVRTHGVVVNKRMPQPLPDPELWPLVRAALEAGEPDLRRLADLAEGLRGAYDEEAEVVAQLQARSDQLGVPMTTVPRLAAMNTRVDPARVADALGAP